jgi:hypothetical protein
MSSWRYYVYNTHTHTHTKEKYPVKEFVALRRIIYTYVYTEKIPSEGVRGATAKV